MRFKPAAFAVVLPLVALLLAACGANASNLKLYSGYADSLNKVGVRTAPPSFPNPWRGSNGVQFIGTADPFDAGALRVENTTGDAITVDKVTVDIGSKHYDFWGSNLKIPANGSLILTQTELGTQNPPAPNFDTSEPNEAAAPGNAASAASQGSDLVPVIHLTVGGHTTDYRDTGKVLTTGGTDKGNLPGAPNESHSWQLLSAVAGSAQGGLSPTLIFAPLAALLLAFLSWLPRLVGALVLLLIGWLVASALARLVMGLLTRTGFAAAADRTGLFGFVGVATRGRRGGGAAWLLAQLVKWFVFLIFLSVAAEAVGLAQISALVHRIILWIPSLLVALIIAVLGVLFARLLGGLVRGALTSAGMGNAPLLARVAEFGVVGLASAVALTQIGVATLIVDILLLGIVLAAALTFGLAFGLGGRTVAAQMWRNGRQVMTPSTTLLRRGREESTPLAREGSARQEIESSTTTRRQY